MPLKDFVLSLTGLQSATRTAIANLTAHELKQRGYNIEPLAGQPSAIDWISLLRNSKDDEQEPLRRVCESGEAIVLAAIKSKITQTVEDLRNIEAFVEIEIGITNDEKGDESRNFTKIFLPPEASPEQSVAEILAKLEGLELITARASENSSYDEDDEAMIRSRLEALGYL